MVCLDIGPGSGRVKISDIAALPVQTGAAFATLGCSTRPGVLANDTLARIAATGEGLPMVPAEASGRVSKVSACSSDATRRGTSP